MTNRYVAIITEIEEQKAALQTIIDAKRALLHTSHPITQIAQELGFKNATHFTRFFKHIVKKTPIQFRKT